MEDRLSSTTAPARNGKPIGIGAGGGPEKDNPVADLLGVIDELNSYIGLAISCAAWPKTPKILTAVQHDLVDFAAGIGTPDQPLLTALHVGRLERQFENASRGLAPLKDYILPGGSQSASQVHVSRAVCRRAEQCLVSLAGLEDQAPTMIRTRSDRDRYRYGMAYLDKLSDLLFVIARQENKAADHPEVPWQPEREMTLVVDGDEDPYLC
ncbi:cob(I)yrinic acid a,c-diamide adenosyltransferase [Rhizobium hainanense]|uniref:Corrinoid adenosyltransferase n=1 Tax=Rhizobium hainanense TaxID=52131 RepID=A0A1C3W8Z3_9HYPH|nr:cob(I)yrinic acid a,c-diamide adenosyltransferase [Rhizobium hainanense]SCB36480.1 cob(I)alamin adenosyltransferase [Rhizobium hainanense]